MQWLRVDTDEDHAAAVFFNVAGAEWLKSKIVDGKNDPEVTHIYVAASD